MCRVTLLFFFPLFFPSFLYAQAVFQPASSKAPRESLLLKKMDARLEKDLERLPKKNKEAYTKIYTERTGDQKLHLTEGHFLFDTTWNNWFDGILQEIWKGNPALPKAEITLFLARYPEPNAMCLGEGSLVFNLGLLASLESESQVAFVLCHEIAHYVQNHVNHAIDDYVEALYGEETQQRLKEISQSEFGKTGKALALMKGFTYGNRRHSRYKESEADSLAVVYLSRTRYKPAAALEALAILDRTDSVAWREVPYKTLFDAPQYPFQPAWLQQKKNSLSAPAGGFKESAWSNDSLKTHPDCRKRIAQVGRQLPNLPAAGSGDFLQTPAAFANLRKWSAFEIVEGLYDFENYGYCLFRTLQLLQEYPDDAYLNAMVVKCLYHCRDYQQNHELRRVLDLPDPANDAEYNRFLGLMNQLRLRDLAQIGYYYCENRREKYQANEDFLFAAALASYMNDLTPEFQQRRREYIRQFPGGRFALFLKQLN